MIMTRIFFSIVLFSFCCGLSARMYQWMDPDTGTTQFSGKPPIWYRADGSGPRVFVFENGKLIDDTGKEVTPVERDSLRQQAFIRAEEDKEKAKEKLLQAKRLKAKMDQENRQENAADEEIVEELIEPDVPEAPSSDEGPTAEDMRALIDQWEKLRKEDARKLLDEAVPEKN